MQHVPVVEMSPTTLLFNDVNGVMYTTCGISDRKLVGSFLVSYQNCSVSMGTFNFTNQIVETIPTPLFVPSVSLKVIKENVERRVTIHTVEQLHQDNFHRLKHLHLTTETHQWTIIGGFSLSTIAIIFLILFNLIKARTRSPIVNIAPDRTQNPAPSNPPITVQYYQPPSSTQYASTTFQ